MKKTIFLFLSQMNCGGQERFVSRLSEMISDIYKVYIVLNDNRVINFPIFGTVLNLDVGELPSSFLRRIAETLKRFARLRKAINQYLPIACFSFGEGSNLINVLSKKRGTRVLTSIRGYASAERMAKSYLSRILYPHSDKIVCVSKGIEARIHHDLPKLKKKTVVLYNAYDCERVQALSKNNLPAICDLSGPKLVSVGTLRPEKGYWHLIKAVWVLKHSFPKIHLSIVGRNYKENGSRLQELIDQLNLQQNVTLEGYSNNPYAFIAYSDVYVLSSVREGFPNALVEAMACRRPVVAADCLTGPREILSHLPYDTEATKIEFADYGILVPRLCIEEDYSATILPEEKVLAQAINLLLENTDLQKEYGERAYSRALEFSYETCRSKVIDLLEGNN
jgi:glycosyltransferase involved in cell wall biosynthesis